MATPNLFSDRPVVILAWVLASTSGFTRSATRAVRPSEVASAESIAGFLGGFDVDLGDVLGQRQAQLALGLADAGEDDGRGRDAGGAGGAQLAFRDDVGAQPLGGQHPQHREAGIGLHRVVDAGRARPRPAPPSAPGRGGAGRRRNRPRWGSRRRRRCGRAARPRPSARPGHAWRGAAGRREARRSWGRDRRGDRERGGHAHCAARRGWDKRRVGRLHWAYGRAGEGDVAAGHP